MEYNSIMCKESVTIKFSREESDLINEVLPIVGKLCDLEPKLKEFIERGAEARSEYSKIVDGMVRSYYTCIKIIQAKSEGSDVNVEIVPQKSKPLFTIGGKTFY